MAPNKFEKKIKELFDAREIEPSGDAWEKVASQLGSSPAKTSIRPWYYWIAASIAFIVFVVGWSVRKSSQPVIDENPMVEQQVTPEPKRTESAVPMIQKQTEISSVKDEPARLEDQFNNVAESTEKPPGIAEIPEDKPFTDSQLEQGGQNLRDEKISEVVAQVDHMEVNKAEVTEEEVDSLLMAAQKALLANEEFQEESSNNGASLLAEVEGELQESFRDQVFDRLKQGFIRVRTAVADRNN